MDATQELATLRSLFYVGSHAKVMVEAKSLAAVDRKVATHRDAFVFRSLIAQGKFKETFAGIDKGAPAALQAVRLFATFSSSTDENKDMVFETLAEWLKDSSIASDPVVRLMACQIFIEAQQFKEALKLVIGIDTLEAKAMTIQIYLSMDRLDLATATLRQMTELDDDDTLTALSTAHVYIAQGGDKVKEAYDLLQELQDKYGSTVDLLNTMAVCLMHQRNFPGAFQCLKAARDMALQSQEKVNAATLVNSIVCLQQLQKPASIINRIVSELRTVSPNHPWLQRQQELEETFTKLTSA